ncbi:MAG: DNA-3-methyladenine glycosylase [Acidobacteriota bacterium]|nr:DNA-3-methyladenine glycosylase [Acidobacteriota bacterium]
MASAGIAPLAEWETRTLVRLPRSFYARPTVEVARDLLGKVIRHGAASARIVETEAYLGIDDAAAHTARGLTARTRVIFGPPGRAYVYLIYGMHYCLNIVAEPEGIAGCVLIRAVEPLTGITQLSNGPGKLTRALGITLQHYGADLTRGPLTIHTAAAHETFAIATSPRIGINKAVDLPLRFFIPGNRFVSREPRH